MSEYYVMLRWDDFRNRWDLLPCHNPRQLPYNPPVYPFFEFSVGKMVEVKRKGEWNRAEIDCICAVHDFADPINKWKLLYGAKKVAGARGHAYGYFAPEDGDIRKIEP